MRKKMSSSINYWQMDPKTRKVLLSQCSRGHVSGMLGQYLTPLFTVNRSAMQRPLMQESATPSFKPRSF